jgi:acid phosphatase family membrane protein YuiD
VAELSWIDILETNPILYRTCLAWLVAQGSKVILAWIKAGRFSWERVTGAGGMPSTHSAVVSSLAAGVIRVTGFRSPYTAITVVFALIVMYDATGVRQAAGKQAEALNKMIGHFMLHGHIGEEPLKELLGHTRVEVLVGALVGILIAYA